VALNLSSAVADGVRDPSRLDRFAAIVVLALFALTWPVIDLLGRNAEFFLARRSPKGEIVYLALIATLLIPIALALLGVLPGRGGSVIGLFLIGLLTTALGHLYVRQLPVPWWGAAVLAVILGLAGLWAFRRYRSVRTAGRYLMVAPLVMLAVFVFTMPVGAVLREPDTTVGNPIVVTNPAPVVMLVFDEFPLASIIDPEGNLRSDVYPNFGRLASDGIWFRNAVTVQQQTEHSVPAMLTGTIPRQSQIPVTGHYPFNLFTAVRDRYDLHVHEAITQLCPRALCEGLTTSVSSLTDDVAVVAGHVLLPEPFSEDLPPIDRGWGDFTRVTRDVDVKEEFKVLLRAGPRAPIDRFLEDIRSASDDRPDLFYVHALVPHHPWQYLPDGRTYPYVVTGNPASVDGGGWEEDEFLVAQSMQRHLLQVGFVDHVLGEVITALEEEGIYDDALLVVVADHGIAIRPGVEHQRVITEESVGEIAAIPLFVKPPGNTGGVIDDRRALTIDILPTIADVLGAGLPDEIDGVSLLAPDPQREETTTRGPIASVTYGVDGAEKLAVAARIEELFPGGDPWALRPRGSPDLVGTSVEAVGLETSGLRARLRESHLYTNVDTASAVIPARIGGFLYGDVDGTETLAVSLNGTIAAVTRSYVEDGNAAFQAMVSPEYFLDGANRIEVFEVAPNGALQTVSMPGL
jgi:hypothetical protein